MINETSSTESVTPPVDLPVTGTPANASETQQTHKTAKSLEEALAKIAELEHSHKNATEERDRHRKKLSNYEEAERKAQEAALSEVEKANKRATDAEQRVSQYQQQLTSAQVKLAAQAKGIIDPDLAALAIHNKLEYGEDGQATNVSELLDQIIKSKPYLLAPVAKPAEPETPTTPAQPAKPNTPAIPAMNPGRSNIQPAGTNPPGRIPRLADVYQRP